MKVIFQDMQDSNNSLNGKTVNDIDALFSSFANRKPFLFSLSGDNGYMLTIGYASNCGSVQHSPISGLPPYLMAIADDAFSDEEYIEFLVENTPTPIPSRYCLPIDTVKQSISTFIQKGERSDKIDWEEI